MVMILLKISCLTIQVTNLFSNIFSFSVRRYFKANRLIKFRTRASLGKVRNMAENFLFTTIYPYKTITFFIIPLNNYPFH